MRFLNSITWISIIGLPSSTLSQSPHGKAESWLDEQQAPSDMFSPPADAELLPLPLDSTNADHPPSWLVDDIESSPDAEQLPKSYYYHHHHYHPYIPTIPPDVEYIPSHWPSHEEPPERPMPPPRPSQRPHKPKWPFLHRPWHPPAVPLYRDTSNSNSRAASTKPGLFCFCSQRLNISEISKEPNTVEAKLLEFSPWTLRAPANQSMGDCLCQSYKDEFKTTNADFNVHVFVVDSNEKKSGKEDLEIEPLKKDSKPTKVTSSERTKNETTTVDIAASTLEATEKFDEVVTVTLGYGGGAMEEPVRVTSTMANARAAVTSADAELTTVDAPKATKVDDSSEVRYEAIRGRAAEESSEFPPIKREEIPRIKEFIKEAIFQELLRRQKTKAPRTRIWPFAGTDDYERLSLFESTEADPKFQIGM